MADIPLKSDDEMTNDLVGAVENIAQSIKTGSRDFSKSFNGLTNAIKKLQATLVNAIKAIKLQVVTKPEKVQKQPTKEKSVSTKEVEKVKEKIDAAKEKPQKPLKVVVEQQDSETSKEKTKTKGTPSAEKEAPVNNNVSDAEAMILKALSGNLNTFWKKAREFSAKKNDNESFGKAIQNLLAQGKIKRDDNSPSVFKLVEAPKESSELGIKKKGESQEEPLAPKASTPKKPRKTKAPEQLEVQPEIIAKPKKANKNQKSKPKEEPEAPQPKQEATSKPKKSKPVKQELPPLVVQSELIEKPEKEDKPKESKAKKPRVLKELNPEEEAEKKRKKKRAEESAELLLQTRRNNAQLSALRLQNALTPKPEKKAPELKEPKETKEEKQVRSIGVPGTKKFVGPRLEEEDLANEKAKKNKEQADIAAANAAAKALSDAADAAAKAIEDAAKRKEKAEEDAAKAEKVLRDYFRKKQEKEAQEIAKATADAAKAISDAADQAAADAAKALKNKNKAEEDAAKAEKALRDYFRKKQEQEAKESLKAEQESSKAANDLIKQQEQSAKQLEQANQKVQKELDSMIAGFQRLTPLFKGPLVSYGLKMIAKGIGYKQPQTFSKGGSVSYLADGGDASNPMKPKGTDTQPAMLTPGEFVVNKDAAQDPENRKQLESINSGKGNKKVEYHSSGGSVGGVGYYAAGGPVGAALGAAVTISGIVINSFTSAVKLASDAIATFGSFVAKANPAVMQKLEIIFNDLQGVIGRAVAPAFIHLTPLLRRFADYVDHGMKLIAPSISKAAIAFDNIVRPLLDLGSVLIEILNPVISLVSSLFLGISEIIKPLIQSFATLIGAVNDLVSVLVGWIPVADFVGGVLKAFGLVLGIALDMITTVASLFVSAIGAVIKGIGFLISKIPFMGSVGKGIAKGGDTLLQTGRNMRSNDPNRIKNGSSTGAAVREVQSMSISSVGDEVRKNALMAASGAKSQEDLLGDISGKLSKDQLAEAFAAGLAKNPKEAVRNLVGSNPFFKGLPNPIPSQNPV